MAPVWRRKRRWAHLIPRTEEGDRAHAEEVRNAKRAIREGRETLNTVESLGDQVGEASSTLKARGEHNHFSELIAEMLRSPNGGKPTPRRG